jgi:hypothetical protein
MKRSILPGCVLALLLMMGLGGCEKKRGDLKIFMGDSSG